MPYPELFAWWAITISWGIAFLVFISIYLYVGSKRRGEQSSGGMANPIKLTKDFIFV